MKQAWWKETVVYQIYPRSFCDSNGDGIGDIRGIISKLDYLKELGVGVVWLSPVYKSPNDDGGYDISDYQNIMAEFGSLADWDEMAAGLHARGIKLLMDLVINHSSDEHAWFVESRKSKDNPYRDYYIWRPGKPGLNGPEEPNNWVSFFGGSAWQLDEATGEYYLHLFSRKQPDLNWENPAVRQSVFDMMCWWMERGVDGFRMDVINLISKVPGLPDAPVTDPTSRYQWGGQYFSNGPRLLEFLGEMKRQTLDKFGAMSVGEAPMTSTQDGYDLTNEETGPLNMIFQFEHMDLDSGPGPLSGKWNIAPLQLKDLKRAITRWQKDLDGKGWNSLYLSNHDQPRTVSRFGDDTIYRVESAKMLGTFLHLLQGTPYIYQGEEIGMTNVRFDSIGEYRDLESLNMYREFVGERGVDEKIVMQAIYTKGRDNARTPMQWSAASQAGFTSATPWLRVNPNYTRINVEQARADPNSIFHYYRRLIELRRANPVIVYGSYDLLDTPDPIYAYTRSLGSERLLVACNFSAGKAALRLPEELGAPVELLIANYPSDANENARKLNLRPYEARVYRLS